MLDPDREPEVVGAHITASASADLDDVELNRCVVSGLRLTAGTARRLRLTDVVLRDCELSGADVQEARWERVRLERCRAEGLDAGLLRARDVVVADTKLTGAGLRMTRWERCTFEGSDLRTVELLESVLDHVQLVGCDLSDADITRVALTEVRIEQCRLDGLRGARALAGASLDSTHLVPLALAVFADLGIAVDAGDPDGWT